MRLRNQAAEDFARLPDIDGARTHVLTAVGTGVIAAGDKGPAAGAHSAFIQCFYQLVSVTFYTDIFCVNKIGIVLAREVVAIRLPPDGQAHRERKPDEQFQNVK